VSILRTADLLKVFLTPEKDERERLYIYEHRKHLTSSLASPNMNGYEYLLPHYQECCNYGRQNWNCQYPNHARAGHHLQVN
jgi:hypothetical protein